MTKEPTKPKTEPKTKRKKSRKLEDQWKDANGNATFWDLFDNLCHIQCKPGEIASVFNTTTDRLNDACHRVHGKNLREYRNERAEGGRCALRRKQWEIALEGNVTMLIWLGKNTLGQADAVPAQAANEARDVAIARKAVEKNPKLIDEIFAETTAAH